jgi:hypothetical protein
VLKYKHLAIVADITYILRFHFKKLC